MDEYIDETPDFEEEDEMEEDGSDCYEEYGDLEMGFNPYMGSYDYDC